MSEILGRGRSRVRDLYRRWSRRWNTIAADSFQRVAEEGLGTMDTGHDWAVTPSSGSTNLWVVRDGIARLREDSSGVTHYGGAFIGYSDQVVRARITIGAAASSPGVGVVFRLLGRTSPDWDGLFFGWAGGTTWLIGRMIDTGTISTSSLATEAAGPSVTAGVTYEFKVIGSGTTITGYLDGTQVMTTTSSTHQTNQCAGIYVRDYSDYAFDGFRCQPSG